MMQNRAVQGLFTFAPNDQLCKQMWLLLEKKRHNWAPGMAPKSELRFEAPNYVSLSIRRRKPKSGAHFGARTGAAFWINARESQAIRRMFERHFCSSILPGTLNFTLNPKP